MSSSSYDVHGIPRKPKRSSISSSIPVGSTGSTTYNNNNNIISVRELNQIILAQLSKLQQKEEEEEQQQQNDPSYSITNNFAADPIHAAILSAVTSFVTINENPHSSPNFKRNEADDLRPLVQCLETYYRRTMPNRIAVSASASSRPADSYLESTTTTAASGIETPQTSNFNQISLIDDLNSSNNSNSITNNLLQSTAHPHSIMEEIILYTLKALKILSRKRENRLAIDPSIIAVVILVLNSPGNSKIACECANVILNMCYEKENVSLVIKAGDAVSPLIAFLSAQDADLQAAAAGAIQSICFQRHGKESVSSLDGISAMVPLLLSANNKVRSRVVGALHNLSSNPMCVDQIRLAGGIPFLVALLRTSDPTSRPSSRSSNNIISRSIIQRSDSDSETTATMVGPKVVVAPDGTQSAAGVAALDALYSASAMEVGSAAGCIQNMSRDDQCRVIIRDSGAVLYLTDLLFADHVFTQVCAVGALLNILGPDLGPETPDNPRRRAFKQLLSTSVATGQLYHIVFSSHEDMVPLS